MIFYFLVFFVLCILSLYEVLSRKKINNVFYFVVCTLLISMAGFRWKIGTDFNHYERLFNLIIGNPNLDLGVEKAFCYISKLLGNFKYLLLFYAFFSVFFAFLSIRHTKYPFSSFFLYYTFTFLSYDMGRIRQGLAISLCLYALFFLLKNKRILFYLFIILAFVIHKTSIVFIFVIALKKMKISDKMVYITLIVVILCSFLHIDYYISIFMKKISFLSKYSEYFSSGSEFSGFSFSLKNFRRAILVLLYMKVYDKNDVQERLYFNLFLFGSIIFYLFKDFPIISERISFYFCVYEIFLIPLIFNKYRYMIVKVVFMFIYGAYYFLSVISINENDYFNMPYINYQSWIGIENHFVLFVTIISLFSLFLWVIIKKNGKNKG